MVVAITMGDAAGVGPEIILKAYSEGLFAGATPLVVGDAGVLRYYSDLLGMQVPIREVSSPDEAVSGSLCVLSLTRLVPGEDFEPGVTSAACGDAVVSYIKEAVSLCLEGSACAMVTAPISKASMHEAGHPWPGHTELLAELTGTTNYAMMLVGGGVRVSLVTIHVALREVPLLLSESEVYRVASLTASELVRLFGIERPRVAVCGLNPHAGEGGAFGDEEAMCISPAVERLREEGLEVSGPHPADTVFHWHVKGKYHAVVAMYHDQGLIPVKLLGFDEGVNITLGLPIIRTSPDHGTAFDIAGKGMASPRSLVSAYRLAVSFSRTKEK